MFGVDQRGLDKVDRALLRALCERCAGGPVGLSTLAISVAEPTETVEDVYEPFLIREGCSCARPRPGGDAGGLGAPGAGGTAAPERRRRPRACSASDRSRRVASRRADRVQRLGRALARRRGRAGAHRPAHGAARLGRHAGAHRARRRPPDGVHPKAKHELFECCIEIVTGVCATVAEAA
ncbi:MAG: Holliday junction DNA helicase RuvB C-terminal domain-containing protein [Acidimicrobiales bacterium]